MKKMGVASALGGMLGGVDSLIPAPGEAGNFAAPAINPVRPLKQDWLRWGCMFTTDTEEIRPAEAEHLDMRKLVRSIAEASGTLHRLSALTYMGYVYYDGKYPPKAPGLGNHDWFAEAREEGDRYGIKLIGYFNFDGYRPDHPCYGKYDVVDENGRPESIYEKGRAACLNWPGWRDRILGIIDEVTRKYNLDGVYTDWDSGYHTCYCEQCRKLYQREYGAPIPGARALARWRVPSTYSGFDEGEDLIADPAVRQYAEWKSMLTAQWLKQVSETARHGRPDFPTLHHLHPNRKSLSSYDGLLSEGGERNRPDVLWRSGSMANAGRVYSVPTFINLFINTGISSEEYKLKTAQVLASGCYPNVITLPIPDPRQVAGAAEIFRLVDQNREYFDFSTTDPVRFLALPRPPLLEVLLRDELVAEANPIGCDGRLGKVLEPDEKVELVGLDGKPLELVSAERKWPALAVERFASCTSGMYGALALSRLPVCSVHREYFLEQFQGYRVLCLANQAAMSDAEAGRVREFVAAGGGLIATYETSLYDEHGAKRKDFALADVLGVHYAASDRYLGAVGDFQFHFTPKIAHPVNEGMPVGFPVQYCELVVPVSLAGAETLAYLEMPSENNYSDDGSGHVGTLRDSLQPGKDIGPGITAHEFGKGRVVYFAGRPDSVYLHWAIAEMRLWLQNAVRWVSRGEVPIEIQPEAQISVGFFSQPGRHIVHLVNMCQARTPVERPNPPVRDLHITVRLPESLRIGRVQALVAGKTLDFHQSEKGIQLALPELLDYEVIGLEHSS
jgi:hypothetical protein